MITDDEEQVVAELELLGIRYLSRQTAEAATQVRPPERLLADMVRQPSARVRAAVIALLLAHPDFRGGGAGPLRRIGPAEQVTLRMFYTAAVLLQQAYGQRLLSALGSQWRALPDLYSGEHRRAIQRNVEPAANPARPAASAQNQDCSQLGRHL